MKENIRSLLKEIKKELISIYGKKLFGVYLYGSYARYSACNESDVDIAIILNDFNKYSEEIERTSKTISRVSLKYDIHVSRVILKEHQWREDDFPFFINLRREGVPV